MLVPNFVSFVYQIERDTEAETGRNEKSGQKTKIETPKEQRRFVSKNRATRSDGRYIGDISRSLQNENEQRDRETRARRIRQKLTTKKKDRKPKLTARVQEGRK